MGTDRTDALGVGRSGSDVDAVFVAALTDVLATGHHVSTFQRATPEMHRGSQEILDYAVHLTNPRARITTNPARRLNLTGAIARFVWMMSGNDRLEDIAFYEPKVRSYSDNQISVPGSNYGMRLLQPRPGLNQIDGVLQCLTSESGSRRAAAVIWGPEDAVRSSRDIPCAFGTFYHIRNESLVATTVMRSNNAFILLPYNVFEFTLLAEIVARSLGISLGAYVHFAASMHVYDGREAQAAQDVIAAYKNGGIQSAVMPEMPSTPNPMTQVGKLAQLEGKLRHAMIGGYQAAAAVTAEAEGELDPYWGSLYHVLLAHALKSAGQAEAAAEVVVQLPPYLRANMPSDGDSMSGTPAVATTGVLQMGLGIGDEITSDADEGASELALIREALAPGLDGVHYAIDRLDAVCDDVERLTGKPVSRREFGILRKRLLLEQLAAAARAGSNPDSQERHGLEEVLAVLAEIRAAGDVRQ